MRIVIQRVLAGEVIVSGKLVSKIDNGLVVFVGIEKGDTEKDVLKFQEK